MNSNNLDELLANIYAKSEKLTKQLVELGLKKDEECIYKISSNFKTLFVHFFDYRVAISIEDYSGDYPKNQFKIYLDYTDNSIELILKNIKYLIDTLG